LLTVEFNLIRIRHLKAQRRGWVQAQQSAFASDRNHEKAETDRQCNAIIDPLEKDLL
jgi:hypothetical protein